MTTVARNKKYLRAFNGIHFAQKSYFLASFTCEIRCFAFITIRKYYSSYRQVSNEKILTIELHTYTQLH